MSDTPCVHEILSEANTFTRTEDADSAPRLDQLSAWARDYFKTLHVDPTNPDVIEGAAAGIATLGFVLASLSDSGAFAEAVEDELWPVLGELTQALAILYDSPPAALFAALTVPAIPARGHE